jgi:hypothetical protein
LPEPASADWSQHRVRQPVPAAALVRAGPVTDEVHLEPAPRPPASPRQSGLFSVLSQSESTQIMIINRVMFLEAMLLAEGMHIPGQSG